LPEHETGFDSHNDEEDEEDRLNEEDDEEERLSRQEEKDKEEDEGIHSDDMLANSIFAITDVNLGIHNADAANE